MVSTVKEICEDLDKVSLIRDKYLSGESMINIGKDLGVCWGTINKVLLNKNIRQKCIGLGRPRYNFNYEWFDTVDTDDKAYFLGLMYADGNVSQDYTVARLCLKEEDKYILEYFSKIFFNGNIHLCKNDRRKNTNCYENGEDIYILNICRKDVVSKFVDRGCVPNKTFKLKFPGWLDESLYKHFFRGLMDGDGSICQSNKSGKLKTIIEFVGTQELVYGMVNFLYEKLQIKASIYNKSKVGKNTFEFRIFSYENIKKFLDWIYIDSNVYLKRKYKRYLLFLEAYNTSNSKHHTKERINQVLDLYYKKAKTKDIANLLNITIGSISHIVYKYKNHYLEI